MKTWISLTAVCVVLLGCEGDKGQAYVNAVASAQCGVTGVTIDDNSLDIREPNENVQWSASVQTSANAPASCNNFVQWSSDNTDVATVSGDGLIRTLSAGVANITANVGRFSTSSSITVSNAAIQSINLTPSAISIHECGSQTITATGTYDDGTTRNINSLSKLTWTTDDTALASVADISASGVTLLSHDSGTGTLTVAYTGGISSNATLTMLDTLSSISLSPLTLALEVGDSSAITATGNYSDNSSSDITQNSDWSLEETAQASFVTLLNTYGDKGELSARAAGTAVATAECGGLSAADNSTITVTVAPVLESVAFSTTANPLYLNTDDTNESLVLNATYSNDSIVNVTESATWEVITGDDDYISVDDDAGDKGEIILSDDIEEITEDKSIIVRATFEDASAQIEIIVLADD